MGAILSYGALMVVVLGAVMFFSIRIFNVVFDTVDELNASVQENVGAIRVVKAFVREAYENEKFQRAATKLHDLFVRAEGLVALNNPAMMLAVYGCIIERGSHDQLMAQRGRYWQLYTGGKVTEYTFPSSQPLINQRAGSTSLPARFPCTGRTSVPSLKRNNETRGTLIPHRTPDLRNRKDIALQQRRRTLHARARYKGAEPFSCLTSKCSAQPRTAREEISRDAVKREVLVQMLHHQMACSTGESRLLERTRCPLGTLALHVPFDRERRHSRSARREAPLVGQRPAKERAQRT